MHRVVDINVSAWTRIRSFNLLVARSIITAVKGSMNCFFRHNFILDVIFLFLVVVLARPRVLRESLPSERSLPFVLPELSPFSFGQERLRLLTNELAV